MDMNSENDTTTGVFVQTDASGFQGVVNETEDQSGSNYNTSWSYQPAGIEMYFVRLHPPIILIVGIVGNTLILTFSCSRRKRNSSFMVYLSSLAISDMFAVLAYVLLSWVPTTFNIFLLQSIAACKLGYFSPDFGRHLSSWFVAALTVERAICTVAPHKAHFFNKRKTGCLVVAVIVLLAFLLNMPFLIWTTYDEETIGNTTYQYCWFPSDEFYDFVGNYWDLIDLFAYTFIPSTVIIVGNFILVKAVIKSAQIRTQGSSEIALKQNRNLLVIAIMVSTTFVFCTLPYSLSRTVAIGYPDQTEQHIVFWRVFWNITRPISMTNHAINFFLYIMSGKRFRKDLKDILFCK